MQKIVSSPKSDLDHINTTYQAQTERTMKQLQTILNDVLMFGPIFFFFFLPSLFYTADTVANRS